MTRSKLVILIIAVLVLSNMFFAVKYFNLDTKMVTAQNGHIEKAESERVLVFTKLFVSNVLKAESEISLETRVELENAVKATEDDEIVQKWQDFTNSKTDFDAQKNVKDLLELLVNKI